MKKDESIGFEKAENGYIIKHSYHEAIKGGDDKIGYEYITKNYIAKTASETQKKIAELTKLIK